MKHGLALLAFLALVSCGADGEPIQPSANLNVGVGSGGVHAGGSVGISKGPLNVSLGRLF